MTGDLVGRRVGLALGIAEREGTLLGRAEDGEGAWLMDGFPDGMLEGAADGLKKTISSDILRSIEGSSDCLKRTHGSIAFE